MLKLNECRVTDNGDGLIIEASVDTLDYYKNVYIDSVIIDTDETYSPNGPSNNPIYKKIYTSDYMKVDVREDCNSIKTDEECKCGNVYTSQKAGIKKISLCLDNKEISNLNKNIFFVYVVATGIPAPCTPCGMDNSYVMGVAVNLRPVYNMMMSYVNEIGKDCSMSKGFIDKFIKLKAFDLSLRTGNFLKAIDFWKTLFKDKKTVSYNKGCGCHGTYN